MDRSQVGIEANMMYMSRNKIKEEPWNDQFEIPSIRNARSSVQNRCDELNLELLDEEINDINVRAA